LEEVRQEYPEIHHQFEAPGAHFAFFCFELDLLLDLLPDDEDDCVNMYEEGVHHLGDEAFNLADEYGLVSS
jgi:hypothetical protein